MCFYTPSPQETSNEKSKINKCQKNLEEGREIRGMSNILIVAHVFLDVATLTEVFPGFFLGCKANARV